MRKDLNWMWILVLPLLLLLPVLSPEGGNLLLSLAWPFVKAGEILRKLSLSGGMGNLAAIGLYIMLCIAPLFLIRKDDSIRVNGLLAVGSAMLFWVMWLMVNPGQMPAHMRNDMGKALYAGTIYSVMITWGVLKLMSKTDLTVQSKIYEALRIFLLICAGQFLFVGLGLGLGQFRTQLDAAEAGNTALSDMQLMPSIIFITMDFCYGLLENLGVAWVLMLGTRLLDALEEDPYSQRCHALSVEIFRWCKKMIPLVAGVNLTLNLAQVLLAPLLVTVHLELRLPILSLAVAFGMMALTRLLEEGKAIKEDNDLFV